MRTVLGQPAGDAHDRAVRWRQLVDLLARAGPLGDSPQAQAALDIIREDAAQIDEGLRAAAARAIAAFPLPFELIRLFAADSLKVSAPILAAANLAADQWQDLLVAADEEAKTFIISLHPQADRRSPRSRQPVRPKASEPQPPPPSISDVIARIERLREAKQQADPPQMTPAPPPTPPTPALKGDEPALFRWECNTSGEFAWVEGAPRGALIGRALVDPAHLRESGNDEIARAFSLRAPFRNAVMTLGSETLLAGEWQVSGLPAFEPASGRFAGYRGVAKRVAATVPQRSAPKPDSLRELVHEIKTPLNAIMGFAEIIEGQMFGPADNRYRARAAEIVSQAQLLLAALDDLDFAARSRSAGARERAFVNLGQLVEAMTGAIRERAHRRGVEIDSARTVGDLTAAGEPVLAERLVGRMCEAVIERAEKGERLRLLIDHAGDFCRVAISRPAALRGVSDEELFARPNEASVGSLWLRLTRGLAQMAGADLLTSAETIALSFPCASLGDTDRHGYGNRTGRGL
ncbi:MAG: histidine kinase dimerization/phospho-acceptor domain-containing protein [Sphingomicrobium sp.]